MKLRRLMQNCPSTTSLPKGRVVRHSKIGPPMTQLGHERRFRDVRDMSVVPLIPAVEADIGNRQLSARTRLVHRSKIRRLIRST
jgi:hypothetical protein